MTEKATDLKGIDQAPENFQWDNVGHEMFSEPIVVREAEKGTHEWILAEFNSVEEATAWWRAEYYDEEATDTPFDPEMLEFGRRTPFGVFILTGRPQEDQEEGEVLEKFLTPPPNVEDEEDWAEDYVLNIFGRAPEDGDESDSTWVEVTFIEPLSKEGK